MLGKRRNEMLEFLDENSQFERDSSHNNEEIADRTHRISGFTDITFDSDNLSLPNSPESSKGLKNLQRSSFFETFELSESEKFTFQPQELNSLHSSGQKFIKITEPNEIKEKRKLIEITNNLQKPRRYEKRNRIQPIQH